jgi:hypothetical protein
MNEAETRAEHVDLALGGIAATVLATVVPAMVCYNCDLARHRNSIRTSRMAAERQHHR